MHNKKEMFSHIIKRIGILFFLFIFVLSISRYSAIIGLFNDIDIQIKGNNYVDATQIERLIYPHLNSSLLSVALKDIQEEIIALDYIETVQISRVLPHTLLIHVVERVPAVLINWDDKQIFMDRKGILMPADNKAIATFPVPVLTIIEEDEFMDISIRKIAQFFKYLLTEYPFFYNNLSEVIINTRVWIFYSDNNTRIYALNSDLFNQFKVLQNFENTVYPKRQIQDYSYIDLRIKNQVIVKEKHRQG